MPTTIDRPKTPQLSELKEIFKSPRLLKAFQDLFDAVPTDLNVIFDMIEATELESSAASAKAVQALSLVSIAKQLAEQASLAPAPIPQSLDLSFMDLMPYFPHGNSIKVDYLEFETALDADVGHSGKTGTMTWNKDESTLNIHHPGGVTQQVGHEIFATVKNETGAQLDNGTVISFAGIDSSTGFAKAQKFIADGTIPSLYMIGVLTQDIPNNTFGRATTYGNVHDIDTTGTAVSETWVAGNILYAHPTTAGALTNVKPTAPDFVLPVAVVGIADATDGILVVRPVIEQAKRYGQFSKTADATPAAINTAYAITLDSTEISNGIAIDGTVTSRIVASFSGLFRFDASFQLTSGSASVKNVWLWFRKNGTDITNSSFKISLESATALSTPSRSMFFSLAAGDYIELMWASDSTNVTLDAQAATAFAPSAPACIVNVTQVHL